MKTDYSQVLKIWAAFLADLPVTTRALALAYPAVAADGDLLCYRSTENARYHYVIRAYRDDLTLTLVHGSDSTLPGVATFGQPPEQLRVCACGRWEHASSEQIEASRRHMERVSRTRGQA